MSHHCPWLLGSHDRSLHSPGIHVLQCQSLAIGLSHTYKRIGVRYYKRERENSKGQKVASEFSSSKDKTGDLKHTFK